MVRKRGGMLGEGAGEGDREDGGGAGGEQETTRNRKPNSSAPYQVVDFQFTILRPLANELP